MSVLDKLYCHRIDCDKELGPWKKKWCSNSCQRGAVSIAKPQLRRTRIRMARHYTEKHEKGIISFDTYQKNIADIL